MNLLRSLACALSMSLAALGGSVQAAAPTGLHEQAITLKSGRQVRLNVADGFTLVPLLEGLRRPRFMAVSPDGRLFVGDMHAMGDNSDGAVYALSGWDSGDPARVKSTAWLRRLRNPHSLAFATDAQGRHWLYLALTDGLYRYAYRPGETSPSAPPQRIARFPDGGMSTANGGWHLTRTVVVAPNGKLLVSVGSSCNACIEKEAWRAVVLEMNPDGSDARILARGVRNAVGLAWVDGRWLAGNQGVDHLGPDAPDETVLALSAGQDYGWPHCYWRGSKAVADPLYPRKAGCSGMPKPFARFPAHSSVLGLAWMTPADNPQLGGHLAVALHGSGSVRLGRGYRLATLDAHGRPGPVLIDGFLRQGRVQGRPAGVLRIGADRLLISDDRAGILYLLQPAR